MILTDLGEVWGGTEYVGTLDRILREPRSDHLS